MNNSDKSSFQGFSFKNRIRLYFILFSILAPFVCLFLPAYGEGDPLRLIDTIFSFQYIYVYGWIPALALILLGVVEFYTFSEGMTLPKPRIIKIALFLSIAYQIADILTWNYWFSLTPQIAPILVLIFLLGRLLMLKRTYQLKE
jgi:hypothetical protein